MLRLLALIIVSVGLVACTVQTGRYSQQKDSHPDKIKSNIDFANVVPKYEPYTAYTLRPYTVLGKHYTPLTTGKGFSDVGKASWYGQKFHGHLTSNGEVYDMFAMTAAHTTLPLPSIVRVTNLANGRQTIVRVNDRGPFHEDRIIDLSYAAAIKLDILDTGVAKVKLEVMHVDKDGTLTIGDQVDTLSLNAPAPTPINSQTALRSPLASEQTKNWYIQVAALQDKDKITQLVDQLSRNYEAQIHTPVEGNLVRLRLGPVKDENSAEVLLQKVKLDGFLQAFKIFATP